MNLLIPIVPVPLVAPETVALMAATLINYVTARV
jgi:hypothetical protein